MTAQGAPDGARSGEVSDHYRSAMDTRTIGRDDFTPNEAKVITIERVTKEEVHNVSLSSGEVKRRQKAGESTTVMRLSTHVRGTGRFLPLNRTNAQSLAKLFGGEVKNWIGQRVTFHRVETVYFGGPGAVRIKAASPRREQAAAADETEVFRVRHTSRERASRHDQTHTVSGSRQAPLAETDHKTSKYHLQTSMSVQIAAELLRENSA